MPSISKLKQVRIRLHELQRQKEIVLVSSVEENHMNSRSATWACTADFVVVPVGGIYDPKKLQAFMSGLIPDVHPTSVDGFHVMGSDKNSSMRFGTLYFDECVAREHAVRTITIEDQDLMTDDGVINGEMVVDEERSLLRRTWVRVYPSELIAQAARDINYRFSMPLTDIEQYRRMAPRQSWRNRVCRKSAA